MTRRATVSLTYGFGMICGPAILLSGPFLKLWMGDHFALASQAVAQTVMFGAWANGIAFLPYGFIQARGNPHITAMVGMVELLPFFTVLWCLITMMGLQGAALAWTLRVTLNCIALFILGGCAPNGLWRVAPAVALMLASLLVARLLPMSGLVALGLAVAVGLAFAGLAYRLDPLTREMVLKASRYF